MDKILIVDDDELILRSLERNLRGQGFETKILADATAAIDVIRTFKPDVVLVDVHMPVSGLDILKAITFEGLDVEVVVMTGYATMEMAVQAVKDGAFDFLQKPLDHPEALGLKIRRDLERRSLVRRTRQLEQGGALELPYVLGNSKNMAEVMRLVGRVAPTRSTVLLTGETGTGKEVIARAIHRYSDRESKPFLAVNCSALSEQLIESELFGHEKGSFTGALARHDGLFSDADGGTLFLDEIGEMPVALQAKLLRVLQDGEIRRVGSNATLKVDVRILAATNRNLEQSVAKGKFREDLYYRLNVVAIRLAPLRERSEDVAPLAGFFLMKHQGNTPPASRKRLSPTTLQLLESYGWPGNVRELENVIQRALILSEGDTILPHTLPVALLDKIETEGRPLALRVDLPYQEAKHLFIESFDRTYVTSALERFDNHQAKAAQFAGMDRSNFRKLVLKVGGRSIDDPATASLGDEE
jgi:two-component system response regulator HydG